MGMVLIGRGLSADELHAVMDDPKMVDSLLYGDLDDEDAEMPDPELDVDKAWHGIHYLLTGTAWETSDGAGSAILGGDAIGEDNGYGPARLLSQDAVRAVAAGLDRIDVDTLRARFSSEAMEAADIYPSVWSSSGVFDDYLVPHFAELRRFYRTAAAKSQAVLLAVT